MLLLKLSLKKESVLYGQLSSAVNLTEDPITWILNRHTARLMIGNDGVWSIKAYKDPLSCHPPYVVCVP